jgi:hypothetical protein
MPAPRAVRTIVQGEQLTKARAKIQGLRPPFTYLLLTFHFWLLPVSDSQDRAVDPEAVSIVD